MASLVSFRNLRFLGILISIISLQSCGQSPLLYESNFTLSQDELTFPIEVNPEAYDMLEYEWSVQFRNMVVTPDGSAYTIGNTYTRTSEIRYLLVKWTNDASVEWSKRLTEGQYSEGLGVTYRGGFIYTAGKMLSDDDSNLVVLMKWNSLGQLIWKQEFDWKIWLGSLRNADIVVTSDESIFVTGVSLQSIHLGHVIFLAKFSSVGQLIWNKTIGGDYLSTNVCALSSNNIVVGSYPHLIQFSSDGDVIWNKTCQFYSFAVSPLDTIYTFSHPSSGAGINVSRWSEDGVIEWSYSRGISWTQWVNAVYNRISAAADDSAYLIYGINLEDKGPTTVMMKISPTGVQLWNRSLVHQYGFPNGTIIDLGVAYNGQIFAGGIDYSGEHYAFAMAIYEIGTFTPLISTTTCTTPISGDMILIFGVIGIGTLGIVVVVIYIFRLKKN